MKQYLDMVKYVLDNGVKKENRTGVGTISASGKLTVSAGGISVAGVNRTGNIFTDTTGGTVLAGVNTGDQDLFDHKTVTVTTTSSSSGGGFGGGGGGGGGEGHSGGGGSHF